MAVSADRVLGVPERFSSSPGIRREQYAQAVGLGYSVMSERFGNLANNPLWRPSKNNIIFCETVEQFGEFIEHVGEGMGEEDKKSWASAHALSSTWWGLTAFNMTQIKNPAQLAFGSAHETVHQWSRGEVPTMPETRAVFTVKFGQLGDALASSLEREALEAAIDYTVCEALGIVDSEVDFGDNFPPFLQREALMIRKIMSAWGVRPLDKAFLLTQGRAGKQEIDMLNARVGFYPGNEELNNFYEQGIMVIGGNIHVQHQRGNPREAEALYRRALTWMSAGISPIGSGILFEDYGIGEGAAGADFVPALVEGDRSASVQV
jgi:hypothetical protein